MAAHVPTWPDLTAGSPDRGIVRNSTRGSAHNPPARARRQARLLVTMFGMGIFLAALDQTVVATALPTIAEDVRATRSLSWIVTAYTLAATVATPIAGRLSDTFGHKPVFLAAMGIFVAGSLGIAMASSPEQLIAFRAVQGIGGGALGVAAFVLVADVVPAASRARTQAYLGSVFGVASIVGPPAGGMLTSTLSWRWIFFVNVAAGMVILATVAGVLKTARSNRPPSLDLAGMITLTGLLTCVVLVSSWAGTVYAWASRPVVGLMAMSLLFAVVLVPVERRAAAPVLPSAVWRNRVVAAYAFVGFLMSLTLFCMITYMPVFLQLVFGHSAAESGLLLVPFMAAVMLTSIGAGRVIERTGEHAIFPVAGCGLVTLALLLIASLNAADPVAETVALLTVFGAGIGMVMQVIVAGVQAAVPQPMIGTATAFVMLARSVGGLLGVSAFGGFFSEVVTDRLQGDLARAFSTMFLMSALPSLFAFCTAVWLWRRGPARARSNRPDTKPTGRSGQSREQQVHDE
ncbi:MDR family MFS transporter [Nonomuraea sp. NPDC049695]|uniref:MDR family MFS transporter n=1 Tax=Nonomuraea sp. NPDC049695 TaxID=3154734 RepID=UPI003427A697